MKHEIPFVSREEYMLAIQDALEADPYDPDYHNGMRNPYSGYEVTCEDDYNEYMREYTYNRLCEKVLEQEYDAKISANIQRLEGEYKKKTVQFKQRHKLWRILGGISLILAFLYLFCWYIPNKEFIQYKAGSFDGYESGYTDGHKDGAKEGAKEWSSEGYKRGYVRGFADSLLGDSNSWLWDTSVDVTIPRKGVLFDQFVYISSNKKIHLNPNCSGMLDYTRKTYGAACIAGYSHCQICFQ